jgi:hypothetical protein
MNGIERVRENDLVKLRNHLSLAESTQVAAALAGRALRVFRSNGAEVGSAFDFFFQLQALSFVGNQDVSCAGGGHRFELSVAVSFGNVQWFEKSPNTDVAVSLSLDLSMQKEPVGARPNCQRLASCSIDPCRTPANHAARRVTVTARPNCRVSEILRRDRSPQSDQWGKPGLQFNQASTW